MTAGQYIRYSFVNRCLAVALLNTIFVRQFMRHVISETFREAPKLLNLFPSKEVLCNNFHVSFLDGGGRLNC